jgi:hypothetical protein
MLATNVPLLFSLQVTLFIKQNGDVRCSFYYALKLKHMLHIFIFNALIQIKKENIYETIVYIYTAFSWSNFLLQLCGSIFLILLILISLFCY